MENTFVSNPSPREVAGYIYIYIYIGISERYELRFVIVFHKRIIIGQYTLQSDDNDARNHAVPVCAARCATMRIVAELRFRQKHNIDRNKYCAFHRWTKDHCCLLLRHSPHQHDSCTIQNNLRSSDSAAGGSRCSSNFIHLFEK